MRWVPGLLFHKKHSKPWKSQAEPIPFGRSALIRPQGSPGFEKSIPLPAPIQPSWRRFQRTHLRREQQHRKEASTPVEAEEVFDAFWLGKSTQLVIRSSYPGGRSLRLRGWAALPITEQTLSKTANCATRDKHCTSVTTVPVLALVPYGYRRASRGARLRAEFCREVVFFFSPGPPRRRRCEIDCFFPQALSLAQLELALHMRALAVLFR